VRKVTFRVANSLDGFIARKDGTFDWILGCEESNSMLAEFWKTIDTVVLGRKTYEPTLKSREPFPTYAGVTNYVCSRTLEESQDKSVQIIREDAVEFVRRLKNQNGKGIFVLGGGELAKSFFEADLVDEIGLNVHPILLGSGVPLFLQMKKQIDLELLENRTLKNDCVYLLYRVKR
jgi:dihydrofolate reductase